MGCLRNRKWWEAAGTRAIKTFAQTFLAVAGTGAMGISDVNWGQVIGASLFASLLSVVTSLAGLPEVEVTE